MIAIILLVLVILALFFGALIYVPRRLSYLFQLESSRKLTIVVIVATFSGYIFRGLIRRNASPLLNYTLVIFTAWHGMFFYLFCFLALSQIIEKFTDIPKKKTGVVIVALTFLLTVYGVWNVYQFQVKEVTIPLKNFNGNLDVVVIADLHLGAHRRPSYLEKVVEKINSLEPDLVLIPGDVAQTTGILTDESFKSLKTLTSPVYFTNGNHETYIEEEKLNKILKNNNVLILENEVVHTHGIQLVGLRFMNADENVFDLHPSVEKKTMKDVLPTLNISEESPALLMHHSPLGDMYAKQAGIDVYVAGHTHGGQIFPVNLIGSPFFFKYYIGLYDYEGMKIYVTQGIGTTGVPLRIGTFNEITLLRLKGE